MNATLNDLGGKLLGSFGQLSIELAALAVLIFLASRLLPIQSPALRHFMWIAVLLKPIIALTISSPWTLFTPIVSLLEPGWSSLEHSLSWQHAENTVIKIAALQTSGIHAVSLTPLGWLAALWVGGVAFFLGRVLIGHVIVWRLRWQAQIQYNGPLYDALQQAHHTLDLDTRTQVAISNAIRSPVVLGILKPQIVVPADFVNQLRSDELELIFLHELAHVRRCDNLILLLQRLVTVVLFFHPAIWVCGHLLRREAEQACDDLVVQTTGHSEDYARSLTYVAELAHDRKHLIKRIPIMNVFFATESDLALRIRRTLGGSTHSMSTHSRLVAAVLLCGLATITLPSSGTAQDRDGVDWETVKTTPPEEWSQELKDQITAAGHDVEAVIERVRLGQTAAREGTVEHGEKMRQERIWKAAMATDPDEWSDRLKAAILELMPESTIEEIAEGVRQRQRATRIWKAAMATNPDEWSDRLKAVILELMPESTIEEIAEGIRQRQQHQRSRGDKMHSDLDAIGREIRAAIERGEITAEEGRARYEAARQKLGERGEKNDQRMRDFQRGVIARAMAETPEKWSDELKAAIVKAGWKLDEFTAGVRQRQADASVSTDLLQLVNPNTAVEGSSWGQIKKEASKSE